MPRVNSVTAEEASPTVKLIFDAIKEKSGRIANIFLHMGKAPAVLEGYLAISDAADHASLSPLIREQIALVVSQTNQSEYCTAAHSAIGKSIGLKENDISSARQGNANVPKNQAILQFAKQMIEKKGKMSNDDITALKKAGVNEEEMLEIVLVVTQTIFTNYFNHLTDPEIDFPRLKV